MNIGRKSLTSKQRLIVAKKTNNRCAYCGKELVKGWHVDHIQPVFKTVYIQRDSNKEIIGMRKLTSEELNCVDNYFASCRLCNMKKSIMSIDEFRKYITGRIQSFMTYNSDYRLAVKYGILPEINTKEVKFYFESN